MIAFATSELNKKMRRYEEAEQDSLSDTATNDPLPLRLQLARTLHQM